MENLRKIKGAVIEYYRLKNKIDYRNYLYIDKEQICSYKTYRKLCYGECHIEEIYDEFLEKKSIKIQMNQNADLFVNTISEQIKQMYEMYDELKLHKMLNYIEKLKSKYNYYPYKCIKDVLITMVNFEKDLTLINENELFMYRKISCLLNDNFQICLFYVRYAYIYNSTLGLNRLENVISKIPSCFNEELLIWKIQAGTLKYKKIMNVQFYYLN